MTAILSPCVASASSLSMPEILGLPELTIMALWSSMESNDDAGLSDCFTFSGSRRPKEEVSHSSEGAGGVTCDMNVNVDAEYGRCYAENIFYGAIYQGDVFCGNGNRREE